MHELSIALRLLPIVQEKAREHALARVERVVVRVGRLTGVIPESLAFCFGVVARETVAEGAQVTIEEVATRAKCRVCGETFDVESFAFCCPACSTADVKVIAGRELALTLIEGKESE